VGGEKNQLTAHRSPLIAKENKWQGIQIQFAGSADGKA